MKRSPGGSSRSRAIGATALVTDVAIKSGKIDSSFANVTIGETRLKLDNAPTIWDKLQAAKVDLAIADLPQVDLAALDNLKNPDKGFFQAVVSS